MSRSVRGARVLITGAASGDGRRYAERAVAEHAASVTLWDRDAARLARAVDELGSLSRGRSRVHSYAVDVADLGAIAKTAQRVRKDIGNPDILINDAGIAGDHRRFWEGDNGEHTRPAMQLIALAPMYITREFLPGMIADAYRAARIVNLAPAGAPDRARTAVDAAATAALLSWSDALRRELEQADHTNVKVTTVTGRTVATGGPGRTRAPVLAAADPAHAVDRVWTAMLAGSPLVESALGVRVPRGLRELVPTRWVDLIAGEALARLRR